MPRFSLLEVERAMLDFELPKIVQVTFYAMLLNNVVELGIVSGFLVDDLKATLEGLRWTFFEAWLSRTKGGRQISGRLGGELRIDRDPAAFQ